MTATDPDRAALPRCPRCKGEGRIDQLKQAASTWEIEHGLLCDVCLGRGELRPLARRESGP